MKPQFLTGAIATTVFTISSAISAPNASALTLESCHTASLSIATDCQYVNPRTNRASDQGIHGIDVNDIRGSGLSFFGETWHQNSHYFNRRHGYGRSGHLSLSDIQFDSANISELMLVFKGGNKTTLTGFLVGNDTHANFNYYQPWSTLFGRRSKKNISHISVYYKKDTQVVPTPAAVLPALFGMGVAAVRKRKHGEEVTNA